MANSDWGDRPAGGLDVQLEEDGDSVVVRVHGELDLASANSLEAELRRAIGRGVSMLFLDLGSVDFIDSTGLRVLLIAAKLSSKNGTQLRIVHESSVVEQVVESSGVRDLLPPAR
jgi:anti-anti-sigma factor